MNRLEFEMVAQEKASDLQEKLELLGALQKGHFELRSGPHADKKIDLDVLGVDHPLFSQICENLVEQICESGIVVNVVIGVPNGGTRFATRVAQLLTDRWEWEVVAQEATKSEDAPGGFVVPELHRDARVLLLEDVVTTGGSLRRLVSATWSAREGGIHIVAKAAIVRRDSDLHIANPLQEEFIVLDWPLESWNPEECPSCLRGIPAYS